ncbi:hypothetical protein C9374_005552 [Naegleria lovaniensis]|uniref:Right handed beta helix domain-containing protein n=1 Tax=Naegleria lovaniensis TaxID=51637 RepID=A0AA88GQQ9_NAELO|nr:uncharacterized protein C9374_005552 [Naegleria lovaniensis]KAG2382350.1 hypothetical protein C9374_005552 [Naegleria lovaniensis]
MLQSNGVGFSSRKKQVFLILILVAIQAFCYLQHAHVACETLNAAANTLIQFYVSPTAGHDDLHSGQSLNSPFATLSKAASVITNMKNSMNFTTPPTSFVVNLMKGTHFLNSSVILPKTKLDNFSTNVEVSTTWRALPGSLPGEVKIRGGIYLPPNVWKAVTQGNNPFAFQMLPENAKGNVLQSNLTEVGFKSSQLFPFHQAGFVYGYADSGNELFYRGQPQTVARYPNKLTTEDLVSTQNTNLVVDVFMKVNSTFGKYTTFNSSECENRDKWPHEKHPFAFGYWAVDWADGTEDLSSITSDGRITFKQKRDRYGVKEDQRFYLVNFLSEIDMPGEYIIQDGVVYFWPPASGITTHEDVMISVAADLFVVYSNHQHFEQLDMGFTRGNAIRSLNTSFITVRNCLVQNTGNSGLTLTDCSNCLVKSNLIFNNGMGGVQISGGDRITLTPSNSWVLNNTIHSYSRIGKTYRPGVGVNGVAVTVSHNEIFNADHNAILWGGNNHEFSFNKIYDVCKTTADAGAIYSGRDWSMRGNHIKYNFIYRVRGYGQSYGATCIYLDDMFSSAKVYGNILAYCNRGVLLGGGRNNWITNNIFVNNSQSILADDRGLSWSGTGEHVKNLLKVPFNESAIWIESYPELVNILQENPGAPVGNVIRFNLATTAPNREYIYANVRKYSAHSNNTYNVPSSVFVDPSRLNFTLVLGNVYENSEMYNFTRIPFDEIGLLKSETPSPVPSPQTSSLKPSNSTKPRATVSKGTSMSHLAKSNLLNIILWMAVVSIVIAQFQRE